MPSASHMKHRAIVLTAAAALAMAPTQASAMSLEQACARFASKLQAAVAAGDTSQAQMIYTEGSQRVASNFNGATCPTVKAP
ncbi:MAG: hypothetical protein WAM11_02025 [Cyanobium sp.]